MRRLCLLLCLLLLLGGARAEEALSLAELAPMEEFAAEFAEGMDLGGMVQSALEGGLDYGAALDWLKARVAQPLGEVLSTAAGMLAPALLLAMTGSTLKGRGARLLLRTALLLGLVRMAELALSAAADCLNMAADFSDVVSPAFAALMTATGMGGSAAMISPAAAMAGSLAGDVFLRFGLPLCRAALCAVLAGNLAAGIDLGGLVKLFRRAVGWGAGLAFTVFTALVALQGNLSASLDGVGLRTAKYAVDSAAPVIGSGVSDVWEAYVSGVMAAKSAVGVSGVIALLAAGAGPMLRIVGSMLALQMISVLLDVLGEKHSARALEQAGGVCRMALELCTSALAISMILLGAIMAAGRLGFI